jgi:L-iditol 2-dehydrogenase
VKALVLERPSQLVYKDVPEPKLGPGDVLVRVKACGICGSDVHGLDGSTGRRIPPLIMGHEAAGVIEAVGRNVRGWDPGDRVTFDSTIYCGNCFYCLRGMINLCDNRRVLGVSCADYRQDGALADYVAVPQHVLYRLPDGLAYEEASVAEALSIAFHALQRSRVSVGDSVCVIGNGMIGVLITQLLSLAGCRLVIAVDLDQGRLEMAQRFGAHRLLVPGRDDVVAEVQAATEGRGADAAFEVVGIGQTLDMAVRSVRKGGQVVLVSNLSAEVPLPLQLAVTRELELRASCASQLDYPACLDLLARGMVDVQPTISRVAPLRDGAEWFAKLVDRQPGLMKVILVP